VNKVYDGTTAATVTLSDNHLGNDVVVDSYASASFADKNVGNGKAVTVSGITLSGADAGNYALQNTTAGTSANITPAALTVTAANKSKVYGTANPALSAVFSGFVNNESSSAICGSPSLTTTATAGSDVGSYTITAARGSLSAVNYTFTFVNGSLSVNRATLTVTVANATKVYGQNDSAALTGAITGVQNNDLITAAYSSPGSSPSAAVGTYAIDAVLADTGTGKLALDYDVTILRALLTVKQDSTTTQVTSSANPSNYGQAVTFTVTVTANAPGSGTPTGSAIFYDGATVMGIATLSGGVGKFTTSAFGLTPGNHNITASYSGDSSFLAGASAAFTQSVLSAQQQIALLVNQVNVLVASGVLNSGNGNALSTKLNNAITNLNAGNVTAGVNQLKAFVNQVNAFVKASKLLAAQAQPLIDAANAAIISALA
jgi:hypothetical protein